ncbi:hypothetical protein BJX99DRAFT_105093 [Aspergillus californicus]
MHSRYTTLLGLLTLSASALAAIPANAKYRRDETPNFPSDPDTTSYCTWWWDNDGSIPCADMPGVWGITLADFLRWNPSLTPSCGNFLADTSYCVEAFGEPDPTTSTTTTTTTAGPPGETQPGQIATCNRWDLVQSGDSCDTYTAKYPGVTLADLTTWNSEIGAQCQFLWVGYYICTGVTGFTPTVTTTTATATSTNGVTTPTPTQPGMVSTCDAFHLVSTNEDCASIASANGITQAQFLEWNSGVGAGCSSLWLGYYVCVSTLDVDNENPTATSSTATTTATNGVTTPTPIRPGMVGNCDSFYMVVDGDGCTAIAQSHGISLAQFAAYNPEVKTDCSGLWLGYYVCVSIIGAEPTSTVTTTTTATNGVSTPTPTRPGMVSNCDAFYKVVSGDECAVIAANHGISVTQLYTWNTQIGTACSGLWVDYYICVSIIGVNPTSTTTSAGNGVATPTPTQAGMTGSCRRFALVGTGDSCESIARDAGITLARFYSWNSGVGSSCGSLWLGYYVCIGV